MSLDSTPQDVSAYDTSPSQLALWKRWVVPQLVKQGILGAYTDTIVSSNIPGFDQLSRESQQLMQSVSLHESNSSKAILLMNITAFRRQLRALTNAFPSHFTHTFAIKANPMQKILEIARDEGISAEVASLGELYMALRVHSPTNVMFDCPGKTTKDLSVALTTGVNMTLDNFSEIARVDMLLPSLGLNPYDVQPSRHIGLRINPQIGLGKKANYSVSKLHSKFGTPLQEKRQDIIEVYRTRPWLNMIHVHVGSQSYNMVELATGIAQVVNFAKEINTTLGLSQITTIDIGGGLCTNFESERNTPNLTSWAQILQQHCPLLFTGEFNVVTELGRRLVAKQGVLISEIEYVKTAGNRRVIIQSIGAESAVRTVYQPQNWPLRVTLFSHRDGSVLDRVKTTQYVQKKASELAPNEELYADIAGACCFDDRIAPFLRPLPSCQSGDFVMLHDTGGYFHGSYSIYNIRQPPALYCFEEPATWTTFAQQFEDAESEQETALLENQAIPDLPQDSNIVFQLLRPEISYDHLLEFFTTVAPQ